METAETQLIPAEYIDGEFIFNPRHQFIFIYRKTSSDKCYYYAMTDLEHFMPFDFSKESYNGYIYETNFKATPEQVKILLDDIKAHGYKWDPKAKRLDTL